jgi:TetR/AcrR family transcriptional regulator, cholesterol catabolism regulator
MEMKERIQQKAEELFRSYGVRSVTMDEIATQLGISKKTIYQFFADKEEIVAAVFQSMISQHKDCCLKDKESAIDPVHEIFLAYDMVMEMFRHMNASIIYDLMKYHPQVYTKFHEFKTKFLHQMISSNLEKGIAMGLYREDINIDVMTRFRIESAMMPFNSQVFPDNSKNLAAIEGEIFYHFMYGIVNAKGLKLIEKYKKQRQSK